MGLAVRAACVPGLKHFLDEEPDVKREGGNHATVMCGYSPGFYDGAAVLMLVVAISGLMRMRRNDDDG